jgi:hypothetical protein
MNNKLEKEALMAQFNYYPSIYMEETKENHKIFRTVGLQART